MLKRLRYRINWRKEGRDLLYLPCSLGKVMGFLGGTGNAADSPLSSMYSWRQRVWRGLETWFSYWTILKRFKISPKWKHFAEEGVALRQNNTWIKCRINSLSKGHRIWSTVIIWSEWLKALHASYLQTSCEMQEIQVAVVWHFPICSQYLIICSLLWAY